MQVQHLRAPCLCLTPPAWLAVVHICVAWAVGALMAYLAEFYRREMYRSQRLAAAAHAKELLEAQGRIKAQRQLAAAQAQVCVFAFRASCLPTARCQPPATTHRRLRSAR